MSEVCHLVHTGEHTQNGERVSKRGNAQLGNIQGVNKGKMGHTNWVDQH